MRLWNYIYARVGGLDEDRSGLGRVACLQVLGIFSQGNAVSWLWAAGVISTVNHVCGVAQCDELFIGGPNLIGNFLFDLKSQSWIKFDTL